MAVPKLIPNARDDYEEWAGMVVEWGTAEWAAQDSRVGQIPTGCIDRDPREEQSLAVGDWDWTSEQAWTG